MQYDMEKSLQTVRDFIGGWDRDREEQNVLFKSVLDAADRKNLPKGEFGVPGEKRFPMPDKEHARLALQMLTRAKHLTGEQKAHIRKMAERILNDGKDEEDDNE